jgi:hypothetical protein
MAANFSMDGGTMVKDEQFRMEDEEGASTAFFLDIGQVWRDDADAAARICAYCLFCCLTAVCVGQRDRKSRGYNIDQIYREQVRLARDKLVGRR